MIPTTLSEQERVAVEQYSREIREGTLRENRVWVDENITFTFKDLPRDGEILDVGCCVGRMISIAHQLGFSRYFGVDPSPDAIDYCKKVFPHHQFAVDEIRTIGENFPNRFDAFFLTAVLMHVPKEDLGTSLVSLRQSLKSGGCGFISTPFTQQKTEKLVSRTGLDITYYNHEELFRELQLAGFTVTRAVAQAYMLFISVVAN